MCPAVSVRYLSELTNDFSFPRCSQFSLYLQKSKFTLTLILDLLFLLAFIAFASSRICYFMPTLSSENQCVAPLHLAPRLAKQTHEQAWSVFIAQEQA